MDFDDAKDGDLVIAVNDSNKKSFKFDRVYVTKDYQVLDGYSVCIFSYGQTGTGKTFPMEGNEATNRGVNYWALDELFNTANERTETNTYCLSVSVLEVYNEQIRDFLAIETSKKLEIKQASEGSHHIPGIVESKAKGNDQFYKNQLDKLKE